MKFLVENPDTNPRVVSKNIREVSLTSDPDCPSALVKNVGQDSELWIATTRFWKRKVENEKLKTDLYKASELLREKRQRELNQARMSEPSSAKEVPTKEAQTTQESKGSETTKKVEEETLSLEQQNKFMTEYIAEVHRLAGGKGNMDSFMKDGKDHLAKKNEDWVKEKKNMEEYIVTLFEKYGKNPESCKRIVNQLNKESTSPEHPLVEFISAAKAREADSQSKWEERYQNRKQELEKEATLKEKFISDLGRRKREEVIEKPEPAKRQKMSPQESFDNRYSSSRIPAEWRDKVFPPPLGGAHKLFTDEALDSLIG